MNYELNKSFIKSSLNPAYRMSNYVQTDYHVLAYQCAEEIISVPARPYLKTPLAIPEDIDFLITHGPAYGYLDRGLGCKNLFLSMASARPKYHIFGHVHEEGLKRKAMLGSTTYLNVSYFKSLRR